MLLVACRGVWALEWKPINTAPSGHRVLVCDDKDRVRIAQLTAQRWLDDADTMIGRPVWWMPLPEPPKSGPLAKERLRWVLGNRVSQMFTCAAHEGNGRDHAVRRQAHDLRRLRHATGLPARPAKCSMPARWT